MDEKGKPYKTAGKIDYVAGWYWKAAAMMQGTTIRTALVSTNSITQGEQVEFIWDPLYKRFGIHIDFAHRTFQWDSEASIKAHVHCVIVGFSTAENKAKKKLFDGGGYKLADNINAYLVETSDLFVTSRSKPICDIPKMMKGSQPTDGGFLLLSPEEYEDVVAKDPIAAKYIRQIYGAVEYINNKYRYCLWLKGASPADLRNSTVIKERIEKVREFRLNSPKEATRICADTPTLFQEIRHPQSGEYIIVPSVSSERRRYVPMGFIPSTIIASNLVLIIPNASLYHFGILTSNVHMAWMRVVCGRLKSDYRYSANIVYNNFPWPEVSEQQRAKIEQTAQAILDARALYPDSSLADLYDEVTMPPELRRAHQQNDRAVMEAYGFPVSRDFTESDCVARLFEMYKQLTK